MAPGFTNLYQKVTFLRVKIQLQTCHFLLLNILPSQLPATSALSQLHKSDMQVSTEAKNPEAGDEKLKLDISIKVIPKIHIEMTSFK